MNKHKPLARRLLGTAFALSLLTMSAFAADAEVPIDETNFPDASFRSYIQKFDTNKDAVLSEAEIADVKKIEVEYKRISSLKGVEHFTALTKLDCQGNDLTQLDVSKNTALTELDCFENQLTQLDVSKNTALTYLSCDNNQLTELDVSNNTALTNLYCSENQLTELDVTNNTALEILKCGINQLTQLDVSKNTALTRLDYSDGQLTQLDVSKNTALTKLNCEFNQLTELDVSKNTALTELYCSKNQLTQLDVSKNTALTYLDCGSNRLTQLDVSNNTALEVLGCDTNHLTQLDLSKNTALYGLGCDTNHLTQLDLSNNTALETLYCGANHLTQLDLSNNTALGYMQCGDNKYTVNQRENITLPGKFDANRVSNVVGGKFDIEHNTFSFDADVTEATYEYSTGNSKYETVTYKLVYEAPEVPDPTEPVENPFTDVSTSDYYYEPVQWAVKKGITAGVAEGKFAPNQACTRGQIVTFLWAAAGRDEPTTTVNPFSDVDEGDYYYKAVLWAVENGITAGVSEGKFAPNQVCNRAQTVTFLWAAQGKPPVDADTSFGDVSASDYYANAVKWAAQNGITAGVGGNKFAPSQNCSRGQIVTFLYKAEN